MADDIPRALRDAAVRNAKPAAKPYKLTDGGGLYLLVQPNGARLWRYKFRIHGAEGTHSIGAYPDVSLSDARELHRAARAQVAAGVNPVQARQRDRLDAKQAALRAKVGEFTNVLEAWRAGTDPDLAANTVAQREREIQKHLVPAFRGRSVETIRRSELSALLKAVEAKAPEVARNLRNYMNGIFDHAADLGLVDANPVPPGRLLKPRSRVSHAAMSVKTLPKFMADLDASAATLQVKTAMWLCLLTVCRKSEACGAMKSEFDLEAGEWLIPAERMKARREHWVPLPRQLVPMLREVFRLTNGELLFPNRRDFDRPIASRTLNMVLERMGYHGETVHGFRSVFSTRLNGLGANPDVVERCLAHAPKDAVRAAYNRAEYRDERRAMLQEWADWLAGLRKSHRRNTGGAPIESWQVQN